MFNNGEIKLLLDENVPNSVKENLKNLGYDVVTINDINKGLPDNVVFDLAQLENRIIITIDNHFKKMKRQNSCGIIQYSGNIDEPAECINHSIKKIINAKNSFNNTYARISSGDCYFEYPKNKYKEEGNIIKKFKLEF
jgi:predicted nuclease of predicted toxin-antitoxin system